MIVPGGPFPIMCLAYVVSGFGISLQNAHANGFVASSRLNVPTKLGFLHASYGTFMSTLVTICRSPGSHRACTGVHPRNTGLGALTAPLVATVFSTKKHWSFHFLVSVAGSTIATLLLIYVFRGKRQEGGCFTAAGVHTCVYRRYCGRTVLLAESGDLREDPDQISTNKYKQIFNIREVHIMAMFSLIYVGVEVTIGSMFISQ